MDHLVQIIYNTLQCELMSELDVAPSDWAPLGYAEKYNRAFKDIWTLYAPRVQDLSLGGTIKPDSPFKAYTHYQMLKMYQK